MLILALRAENFMKFHELNVEGLPSDGLIGVEGKNEGGKSTLGELLQFALFAKSATSEQGSVLDLIHWDRDFCTVEVDFVVEGEGAFRIWREIDRYGTNYSRLMPITESGELTGPDLAAGTIQVQQALARLLRFSFDDFGKSFYLAEQDFPRSPEQMRQYLDRMVGADVLIEAATSVQHEIDEYEEEFGRLQASIRRNTQQIEKYLPNIARIPEVEATRDNHGRKLDELSAEEKPLVASETQAADRVKDRERLRERLKSVKKGRLPELQEALAKLEPAYTTPPDELGKDEQVQAIHKGLAEMQGLATAGDALFDEVDSTVSTLTDLLDGSGQGAFRQREAAHRDTIARAGRGRGLALFFAFLCFLLAVALGLFAADLHYGWTGQDWFELAADAERTRIVMIASAASGGVLVLLSLFLLVRASKHRRRSAAESDAIAAMAGERADVEAQRDMLAKIDRKQTRLDDVKQALEGSTISEIVDAANTFDESRQAVLGGTNSVTAYFGKLADRENRVIQKQRNALKECKKKVQQSQEAQKREQSKRDRADSEIHEYHKQAGKQQVLEEQNVELREQADTVRDEIETRRLVLQLYGESVDSIRHRTGPTLGRSMRRLLPHLTGGRYHDLKVTPQFQLQVFTSEKSDFLQPQELSGGTFEALSLGFRLAFAQAFIRAVVHAPQFVFLDEPFKAMDRERIHRTIAVLKQLSQELRQVFVVLPGIAEDDRQLFDTIVETTVGDPGLAFDASGRAARSAQAREQALEQAPETDTGREKPATPSAQPMVQPQAPSNGGLTAGEAAAPDRGQPDSSRADSPRGDVPRSDVPSPDSKRADVPKSEPRTSDLPEPDPWLEAAAWPREADSTSDEDGGQRGADEPASSFDDGADGEASP